MIKPTCIYKNKEQFLQLLTKPVLISKDNEDNDNYFLHELDTMLEKIPYFIAKSITNCSEEIQNDKEVILKVVSQLPEALEIIPEKFKSDYEVVYTAVSRHGAVLQFAVDSFKNNREFIDLAVVRAKDTIQVKRYYNSSKAFPFIGESIRKDKEFIKSFLDSHTMLSIKDLAYMPEELCNDKEIVSKAITECPAFAKLMSAELKNDKEFILSLIEDSRNVFPYISDNLKNDREIIKATMKYSPVSLKTEWYVENLRNDKELVLLSLTNAPHIFKHISERLLQDREVVLAGVSRWGENINYVSEEYKNDREVIIAALNQDCRYAYDYLPEDFKIDKEMILICLEHNPYLMFDVPKHFLNDKEIFLHILNTGYYNKLNYKLTSYMGDELSEELLANSSLSSGEDMYEYYKDYLIRAMLNEKLDKTLNNKPEISKVKNKI